ncbi:ABC transporter permease [Aestuariispira insulae]|uniref:Tungstate transport system permease protein n=1 Tax=Aestuariispira insulae TaxID=1461337 RepID=A0A3D9HWT5_9PROT|nr:ABC transporter permease [Aestuariispira insulae]RED53947.1 tungstate transport system permease protein [Aestuariispira insulae]
MDALLDAVMTAFSLILTMDADLVEIAGLSLNVSLTALLIASLIGLPLGSLLAMARFPGRRVLIIVLNALMGMPPVVIGLLVYILLSRSGPFGVFGLLFSPTAMIIAQVLLVVPIIASLSRQVMEELWREYHEQFRSLGVGPWRTVRALIWDGRFSLLTAELAGFGRAIAEVGAVMIVGGNIDHVTRVMTTAIALEVSKGDLALALGLGLVLILLSLATSLAGYLVKEFGERRYGA